MDINILPYPIGFLDPQCKYNNPLTGQPYSAKFRAMKKYWTGMRTFSKRNEFFELMIKNQIVIAIAGTGTGKTAVIPKLALHFLGYNNSAVYVALPNIEPAIEATLSTAESLDVEVGQQVGNVYPLKVESVLDKISASELDDIDEVQNSKSSKAWNEKYTKLVFGTDVWIASYMAGNPLLDVFGCVFIDEVHKRTVNQDIVLSKLCDIALQRPEFKIVIMSATLDPKPFEVCFKSLGIKYGVWNVEGETNFKIEKLYSTNRANPMDAAGAPLEKKVDEVLKSSKEGNIIVFIATVPQAKTLYRKITANEQKYNPIPRCFIYSRDNAEEAKKYITSNSTHDFRDKAPVGGGEYGRMIIFSTNLGEASITYKNLAVVIDSGLENKVYYNADTNAIVAGNEFIARSNIGQRCGRTGRDRSGSCIMMYSENQYNGFKEEQDPEITITEMSDIYLDIISSPIYGSFDKSRIFFNRMITPPPIMSQYRAMKNLLDNELVHISGYKTVLGNIVSKSGRYGYRLYKMIIAGWYFGCMDEMIHLAAIISILNKDGIDGFFDVVKKEKDKQTPQELEKTNLIENMIKHYRIPYSDHLTLYRIYNESRHTSIFDVDYNGRNFKSKDRRIWLNERAMREKTFTAIDSEVNSISKKINKHLYEIVGLELFRVVNNERQKWKLQDLKGNRQQYGGTALTSTPTLAPLPSLKTFLNTHSKIKTQSTKLKGGDKSSRHRSIKSPSNQRAILLDKLLNNIIVHQADVPPFKTFDLFDDNFLACVFFGSISNLAIILESEDKKKIKYLIKNSSISFGTINSSSVLASLTPEELKLNPIITYTGYDIRSFNLSKRVGELSLCSIIFPHIINKFGISLANIVKKL